MIHQMCTCGFKIQGTSVTDAWRQMDEHWEAVHAKRFATRFEPEHASSWPGRRRARRAPQTHQGGHG